ncbi:MAG: glycoside hydrolase family 10 protein [Vicinamibacterales bacterium]
MPPRFLALLLTLAATVTALQARGTPSLEPPPLPASEVRALWVVRDSLTSAASVQSVVDQAVAGGFNTLFVQVRGRGDAYYLGTEPRAEALRGQPDAFDPLQQILVRARSAGLQVHAWVNVNLVSSAVTLPAARDHIVNRHPEWLMVPRALAQEFAVTATGPGHVGRLARWTRAQADVEGLFLSPIVPGAATYTVNVITELVRRYALDGVHLDYIRYPGTEFDYSRAALDAFAASVAPTLPAAQRARLAAMAHDDVLAWVDAYPDQWIEFRRSRLTALVMRVRSAVRAERPHLLVSAAVAPDAAEAAAQRLQDWQLWAENGLVDVVCPMAYTTDLAVFTRQIGDAISLAGRTAVWAGIGAYRLTPAQTVTHIEAARAAGARGIVLFSYDKMVERPSSGYLDALRKAAFHPARTATP